jgi:hypothetical protein
MKKLDKFEKIIPILFENDLTKSWAIKHLNVIKIVIKKPIMLQKIVTAKIFKPIQGAVKRARGDLNPRPQA